MKISGILQVVLFLEFVVWGVLGALNPNETIYLSLPNRTNTRNFLYDLTLNPHLAGTPGEYDTMVYVKEKFLSYGFTVNITNHSVLINYPLKRVVELLNDDNSLNFTAIMKEPSIEGDPTSNNSLSVPTYNSYAADGNVTAPLVYANYGRLEDFQYLLDSNITVNGSIVIVRYGSIFRGVKAFLAQQFGAVGLLIYSDPADDGFSKGDTYIDGPWRPEDGVQRGGVSSAICPGSPSQSRVALCLGEEHANENYVGAIMPRIPVQPLSWGDAKPFLLSLCNTHKPPSSSSSSSWTGTIPDVTYEIGPSSVNVHLELQFNYTITPIWNVIATLPGVNHDEIVLMGNHMDAWVFGATDPSSGTSAVLETARSLSVLKNTTGWVPQRDIVFCLWDGEEIALLGSTAWAEENAAYLQSHVVAYVNVDTGVAGPNLNISGTPSLLNLIKQVAGDLPYPNDTSTTVAEHWPNAQMGILGAGSDFMVFIHNLGIPSLDLTYTQPSRSGIYHSIYDSFTWMEKFGDPEFLFHEGMAQMLGIILMRLADSPSHPFTYTNYGEQLGAYLNETKFKQNITADFTVLENAISQFQQAGVSIDQQSDCLASGCTQFINLTALNTRLRMTERRLLLNALTTPSVGLPSRPWFKHVVQAPGIYDGYLPQVFPGIVQGKLDKNDTLIMEQINRAATTIENAAQALTELTVIATNIVHNKCYGDQLGAIEIVSQGGFTPVNYFIIEKGSSVLPSPQNSTSFTNLSAGVYVLFAVDALGIVSNTTVLMSQPNELDVTFSYKDKQLTATVTGGAPPYKYAWASTNFTTPSIELNEHGNYYVNITDANGCEISANYAYSPDSGDSMGNGTVAIIVITVLSVLAIGALVLIYFINRRNRNVEKYSTLDNKF